MATGYHVRVKGNMAVGQVFDPLPEGHPMLAMACPACLKQFEPEDRTVLVPLGPGQHFDQNALAVAGQWYSAVAAPVHAGCAGLADDLPAPIPDENIVD